MLQSLSCTFVVMTSCLFSVFVSTYRDAVVNVLYLVAAEQARAGEITNMTGIAADAPYEAPESPEIELKAEGEGCTVDLCASKLLSYLRDRGYLKSGGVDP